MKSIQKFKINWLYHGYWTFLIKFNHFRLSWLCFDQNWTFDWNWICFNWFRRDELKSSYKFGSQIWLESDLNSIKTDYNFQVNYVVKAIWRPLRGRSHRELERDLNWWYLSSQPSALTFEPSCGFKLPDSLLCAKQIWLNGCMGFMFEEQLFFIKNLALFKKAKNLREISSNICAKNLIFMRITLLICYFLSTPVKSNPFTVNVNANMGGWVLL